MKQSNYCGIKKPKMNLTPSYPTPGESAKLFSPLSRSAVSIGRQIIESFVTGVSPEMSARIGYDSTESKGVDVMCSPNHDFFDIAEEFGKNVERTEATPTDKAGDQTDNEK